MKLNIAYPANGTQKCIEMSTKEEQRLYGKKLGEQINGNLIAPEYDGAIFELVGGNDFQGVCMVKGQDTTKRLRLLCKKGDTGYRCKRKGVRKRKTVRGGIVFNETQVLNMVLVKEAAPIEGLTDVVKEKSHLPKKINKLCALLDIPQGSNIKDHLKGALGPDQKMPKLRIVRTITKNEIEKRQSGKEERVKKAAQLLKDKQEYEKLYGAVKN